MIYLAQALEANFFVQKNTINDLSIVDCLGEAKLEWVVVVGFYTELGIRNFVVTVLFLWNPDNTETQFRRRWVIFLAIQN